MDALPQPYRDHFLAGTVNQLPGRFFPAAIPRHVISMAVLFGLMYLLPAVFLLYSGLVAWYTRAPWLARISEDLSGSWGKLAVGLVILAVIVGGLGWMLRMSWLAWLRCRTWTVIKRSTPEEAHYGLLLGDQHLVFRHGEHFDEHSCGWLAKSAITRCQVKTVRHWFPKRSYPVDVMSLHHKKAGQIHELLIPERFGMSAKVMGEEVNRWLQSE
jgi:hypothetical protein